MQKLSSVAKQRLIVLGGVVLLALALLAPSVFRDDLKSGWISKPLALGLDLSGGVHLVYEVQTKEAVKGQLQSLGNSIRKALLDEKVAVWRAKSTPNITLELVLVSESHVEKARAFIDNNYKQLIFRERGDEAGKPKLTYGFNDEESLRIERGSVERAVETLRNRVDQFGVAEPLIQRVGESSIQLQMPGYSDIDKVKRVVGSVAKLEFRLIPVGAADSAVSMKTRDGTPIKVEDQVLMTGDAVSTANIDVATGQVEVSLAFTSDGGKTFKQITSESVGRELAIILDSVVYSHPRINEAISGGRASISGGFTVEEAEQLSKILRAGALPAPLKVIEERTVGPSLGKDAIRAGIFSILSGFIGIMLFMILYYAKSGVVAVISLALNLMLVLSVLAFFGATLTLPGLAGLALTIGMAVDSNVIIFERIRDELKLGVSPSAAIAAGFDKAYSAIIDTNITTFVSGIILYVLGTGMIRGFAVVLITGVATTVFCAAFACRLAYEMFEMRGKRGGVSI